MMKFKSLFRRQGPVPGGGGKGYHQNGKTGGTPHQQQQQQQQQVSWSSSQNGVEGLLMS
jgi:hypothetical protein